MTSRSIVGYRRVHPEEEGDAFSEMLVMKTARRRDEETPGALTCLAGSVQAAF